MLNMDRFKLFIYLFLVPVLYVLVAQPVWAQQRGSGKSLASVKQDIRQLLNENRQLHVEYDDVVASIQQYESAIQQSSREIASFYKRQDKIGISKNNHFGQEDDLRSQIDGRRLAIIKAKQELESESVDDEIWSDQRRAWELKTQSLSMELTDLKVKHEQKKVRLAERQDDAKQKIEYLEDTLEIKYNEEKRLMDELVAYDKRKEEMAQQSVALSNESFDIEKSTFDLEQQIVLNDQELRHLDQQQDMISKALKMQLAERERQKKTQEISIKKLEGEFEQMNQWVDHHLSFQEQREALIRQVIEVDRQNQQMKGKIDDLNYDSRFKSF
jgi:hypothetical protein